MCIFIGIFHATMLTVEQIKVLKAKDLNFITSRSGGKGGQNVNKVESKVELVFNIENSLALRESQKKTLLALQSSKIKNGEIRLTSESERSQLRNKEKAILKLIDILQILLKPKKKRIATTPGKSAKENKLKQKKHLKIKKALRKKYKPED
jgi:ribosome-associated protein